MSISKLASFFIVSIAIVIILTYGQSLLIPFIFALLLWFITKEIKVVLDRSKFIKLRVPSWLKSLIAFFFILFIFGIISSVLTTSITALSESYESYQTNVDALIGNINHTFNIDLVEIVSEQAGDLDFGSIFSSIFSSLSEILGSAFMIILYALFVFIEEAYFQIKLKKLFPESDRYAEAMEILDQIEDSVAKYLGLKTFVSVITGVLSFIVLALIGVEAPVFWAFLIFIMNFIPTVGSLIATIFPAVFCLLQFGDYTQGILVLVFVGSIQILVGNILEPKLMGNSMNISPLVAIIALSFWGVIWGVTGMFLSVPITVIMIIVFAHFPSTRPVAILLSEKGEVK